MNFELEEAAALLERTPRALEGMLYGLPGAWLQCSEGEGTWTVTAVVEHLIEAEHTNWIPRLEVVLREGERGVFPPFDRYAHLQRPALAQIDALLLEFKAVRASNLQKLRSLIVAAEQLERTGTHPDFGVVKARELLSTWVVHDLAHTAQIARIMAKRYRTDVGPWQAYLSILGQ